MDINNLSYLKEQVQTKERQLEAEGLKTPEKKELVKEVINEQIEPVLNTYPSEIKLQSIPQPIIPQEDNEANKIVDELIEIALNKDIVSAVQTALKTSNGYIIDTFRDKLTDVYYNQLKEKGLI
jgi:hypothetical protein